MKIFSKIRLFSVKILDIANESVFMWFVLGLFLLGWVVCINFFPEGYIISGGDVLQLLRPQDNFWFMHYEWTGRVSLFYALFYVLDILDVSETGQLSWYLGVFLFGSYVSFYVFTRLIFSRTQRFISMLTALLYATNVYTLYIFTSTWGFTHYQVLYVFIPLLSGLLIKSLFSSERLWQYAFLLAMFFCSGGSFGNPAFALSLFLYFTLFILILFLFKREEFCVSTFKTIVFIGLGAVLLNMYWILPLIPQVKSGVAGVTSSTDIVLSDSLRKTSNAVFDTIRLMQTNESDIYYPNNFPYTSLAWLKPAFPIVSFIPFFIVLFSLFFVREKEDRKNYLVFFSLLVVFTFLVTRVRFPFETINSFLFQLPGFNTLRGYDKTAIYTPFILLALVTLVLTMLRSRKITFIIITVLICVYGVMMALPFYGGGIQTKMSYIFANSSRKDFQSSKYSALIKIPQEYYDIRDILGKDTSDTRVARLPFSEGSSIGRVNLPRLRINGPAPERFMYSKTFVDPNEIYFPHWRFGEDLENTSYDPRWIVDIYGLMGVKYIVYHKDAKPSSLEKMDDMVDFLKRNGLLSLITDNTWLSLYCINDRLVFPYVYMSKSIDARMPEGVSGVLARTETLRADVVNVVYKKHPGKSLEVDLPESILSNGVQARTFVLNERYDALWRAEFVDKMGSKFSLERDDQITYANGWKLKDNQREGKIIVTYLPVELFYVGLWVSGVTLLLVMFGSVYYIVQRKYRLSHHL